MKTLWLAAVVLVVAPALRAEKLDDWLKKLQDDSASTRREAWQRSEHQGAPAVLPLVKLASGDDSDVRLAALRSLERIAHAAAAPASDRREAVAAELAKGLSEKAPPAVRSLLLDLLGSVGSGEQVDAIAPILHDSQLRDAARRALGRIPGTRATKALLKVAESQIGEALEALVWTLAQRRDPEAVPLLADLSRRGARSTRVAAARALIRIGGDAAREAVVAVMPEATPRERAAISADLIDYAHRLRAEGKAATADGLFGVILVNAGEPQHRSAALLGLCADDPAAYLDLLVSVLDSREDSLRRLALSMLTRAKGEGVDRSLLIDYAVSEGGRKASLLSVLARRKVEGVERLVEAAATEDDLNVRVTALSLSGGLGSVELEPLIFQAVREGTPEVRAVAFQSYLELAEEVTKTSAAAAASMYTNILDHADDGGVLSRALLGLGATGTELAADRILSAREIPQLARDAERAQVRYAIAIGKRGEKTEAIELLIASVGSDKLPRGEVREAIDALKALGADPTVLQKRRGLLTDWWYLGPFPNEDGSGFSAAYSPEQGVDLKSQKDHRGRDRKWGEHRTNHLDGIVDFERLFRRTQDVVAYVYTEIEMPEARELTFKIGSDDGYVCWLNGERIHGNDVTRGLTPDQDTFKATFEKGKNKILLKVTQRGGPWAFVLRLMDGEGKPIDLNRSE